MVSQHILLKMLLTVSTGPITYIVNLSLRSGIFPNEMKIAKVIQLHKKKSMLDAGNYRPVSILSVVGKTVFLQINSYLFKNKLFYQFQSSFRGSYSSDICPIYLLISYQKANCLWPLYWHVVFLTSKRLLIVLTTTFCAINCPLWVFNLQIGSLLPFYKLLLHMGKDELILFGSKPELNKYINEFSIVLSDGQTIRAKHSVVYLGLTRFYLLGEFYFIFFNLPKSCKLSKFLTKI